jgi:hypothetical protein
LEAAYALRRARTNKPSVGWPFVLEGITSAREPPADARASSPPCPRGSYFYLAVVNNLGTLAFIIAIPFMAVLNVHMYVVTYVRVTCLYFDIPCYVVCRTHC